MLSNGKRPIARDVRIVSQTMTHYTNALHWKATILATPRNKALCQLLSIKLH